MVIILRSSEEIYSFSFLRLKWIKTYSCPRMSEEDLSVCWIVQPFASCWHCLQRRWQRFHATQYVAMVPLRSHMYVDREPPHKNDIT
jgi:hypothetical protein